MVMCRACLLTEKNMTAMDETFVINYNLLTNLNVKLNDGMPQYCCQNCIDLIKYFIEFRDKSIASETTLQNVVKKIKPEEETEQSIDLYENIYKTNTIKIEFSEGVDDDDHFHFENYNFSDEESNKLHIIKKEEEINEETDNTYTDSSGKRTNRSKVPLACRFEDIVLNRLKPKKLKRLKRNTKSIKCSERTDNAKELLYCGICIAKFEDIKVLEKHLEAHKNAKHCELCYEDLSTWAQLFSHRLRHVPVKQKRCHLCDKRFVRPLYLEYHYLTVHNDGLENKLKCKVCSRLYVTPRKLQKHMAAIHSSFKYFCDYCSKGFIQKRALTTHVMCAHSEFKNYLCDLCDYSCKLKENLKAHILRKHTPGKVTCKKCMRIFPNQEKRDVHSCNPKITICPICGLQLEASRKLSQHIATHSAVGKYKCDRCPRAYKSHTALRAHLDRHDGVRSKHCEFCPASFYSASVLIKHRRTHTGEKPYVCKVCNKGFTGNNNLKVHMRVHGEFLIVKKNKDDAN